MGTRRSLSRRGFLADAARGALAFSGIVGITSCRRERRGTGSGRPAIRLGLDTYTVHRALSAKDPSLRLELEDLIERLGDLELEGLQIDPSHFPGDDAATLARLESVVDSYGYYVEFGMGGWDPARLARRAELTARFGGRAVRTFCGSERNTQEELARFSDLAAPALRRAAEAADLFGVDIAVENHGDFTSAQLVELLERVGHPRVGACLDTGNSLFRREDPLECARALAPWARSMHLKDWTMELGAEGEPVWTEAVIGEGKVPVAEILGVVLREGRDLDIALENPVRPGGDEAETVEREWNHLVASARAARLLLDTLI